MNLNVQNWQPFRIDRLFDIYTGGDLIMGDIEEGEIPIASNSSENNNIAAYTEYIEGRKLFDHTKSISVADRGRFWAFIQPKDFYLATRVKCLVCKGGISLNEYQMSFIVSVLNQESFKFSYGRNCCAHLPDIEIFLPVQHETDGSPVVDSSCKWSDEGFVPDWKFMEEYIKSLHHKPLKTKNEPAQVKELNISNWKTFRVGDILDCDSTILSIKDELSEGNIPFVSRTAENNGIDGYVEVERGKITEGNCITIGAEGIYAFYQSESFATGNKVYQIRRRNMNRYIGLFLVTVLNLEDYRYSYGRARIMSKLKDEIIKLPVDLAGNPDWQFMEDYIKALPYGDRLNGE